MSAQINARQTLFPWTRRRSLEAQRCPSRRKLLLEPLEDRLLLTVNNPPIANDGVAGTNEDVALNIDLGPLVSDVETSDANLTYFIDSVPAHGSVVGSGPGLIYTPAANFNVTDSFTYHVVDRGAPDGCASASTVGAVEWSVSDGGNGHFYHQFSLPNGITWTDARAAAESLLLDGVAGHTGVTS